MIVGASCTAELIQDDPGGLAEALDLPVPVIPLDLPSYQRKENWGAAETFYQLVRTLAGPPRRAGTRERAAGQPARCNILGPTALGFRHRDDLREITRLLSDMGIDGQRRRAAGRDAGRPRPPGRRRFQRRALPRDRRSPAAHGCSAPSASRCTKTVPDRRRRHPRFHRRSGRARRRRPAPALDDAALALALVRALGRLDLPHRQARLRLRRRHPRDRRRPHRAARSSASRSSASAPTAANSPARCATPPSSTASRR